MFEIVSSFISTRTSNVVVLDVLDEVSVVGSAGGVSVGGVFCVLISAEERLQYLHVIKVINPLQQFLQSLTLQVPS